MTDAWSGGCQCGAVRYRFNKKPGGAHVCHCRMCQKAFGGFYAPLVGARREHFEVTPGEIAKFNSSDLVERGFCRNCGTPLTFAYVCGRGVSVSIGSLDHPEDFPPVDQHGVEGRLAFANGIGALPDRPTTEEEDPDNSAKIRLSNHQHPDHDTAEWPLGGR
jgi:hypothetical protein